MPGASAARGDGHRGLGLTEIGRVYDRPTTDFAAEAVWLALEDAGLEKAELDGLLVKLGHLRRARPLARLRARAAGARASTRR